MTMKEMTITDLVNALQFCADKFKEVSQWIQQHANDQAMFKGDWVAGKNWFKDDYVLYENGLYSAKVDIKGPTLSPKDDVNGDYWRLVVDLSPAFDEYEKMKGK